MTSSLRPSRIARLLAGGVATAAAAAAIAQDGIAPVAPETPARWDLHAQGTVVGQGVLPFDAPYSNDASLRSRGEFRESVSLDVIAGLRLWKGAEFRADAMMWQGYGLSEARGAAGFPNGEAFRKGTQVPNTTFSRVFVRQVVGLGGTEEEAEAGPLQFGGVQDSTRLTITAGKMSAKDVFDPNSYANDPRTQFMNWALMANGAWDYPADALGFAPGVAFDLTGGDWSLRYGVFGVMRTSNGVAVDQALGRAHAMVWEVEHRHRLWDHPGAVRFLTFLNRGRMRNYADTLEDPHLLSDPRFNRHYHREIGFGVNLEQELTRDLGVFSRMGWGDGDTEPWMFTDIDRTYTLGLSLQGTSWGRPGDTVGVAGVWNEISRLHQAFMEAGGQGITVAEQRLSYAPERILETYYRIRLPARVEATLDYQYIANPAYNRDRGPAHVFALRLHWEY